MVGTSPAVPAEPPPSGMSLDQDERTSPQTHKTHLNPKPPPEKWSDDVVEFPVSSNTPNAQGIHPQDTIVDDSARGQQAADHKQGTPPPRKSLKTYKFREIPRPKARSPGELSSRPDDTRPVRPRYTLNEGTWDKIFTLLQDRIKDFEGFKGDLLGNLTLPAISPFKGETNTELHQFIENNPTLLAVPTLYGGGHGELFYYEIGGVLLEATKSPSFRYMVVVTPAIGADFLTPSQWEDTEDLLNFKEFLTPLKKRNLIRETIVTVSPEEVRTEGGAWAQATGQKMSLNALAIHIITQNTIPSPQPPQGPQPPTHPPKRVVSFVTTVGGYDDAFVAINQASHPPQKSLAEDWYIVRGKWKYLKGAKKNLKEKGFDVFNMTDPGGNFYLSCRGDNHPSQALDRDMLPHIMATPLREYVVEEGETVYTLHKTGLLAEEILTLPGLKEATKFRFSISQRKIAVVTKDAHLSSLAKICADKHILLFSPSGFVKTRENPSSSSWRPPDSEPDFVLPLLPISTPIDVVVEKIKEAKLGVELQAQVVVPTTIATQSFLGWWKVVPASKAPVKWRANLCSLMEQMGWAILFPQPQGVGTMVLIQKRLEDEGGGEEEMST